MSTQLPAVYLETDNTEARIPIAIVVDTSSSMFDPEILGNRPALLDKFLDDLPEFIGQLKDNDDICDSITLNFIASGSSASPVNWQTIGASWREKIGDFRFADTGWSDLEVFDLPDAISKIHKVKGGRTPLGLCLLDLFERFSQFADEAENRGIAYYAPWVLIISDGYPTDITEDFPGLQEVVERRVQRAIDDHHYQIVTVGVGDIGPNELASLGIFSPATEPVKMQDLNFNKLFKRITDLLEKVKQSDISDPDDAPPPRALSNSVNSDWWTDD